MFLILFRFYNLDLKLTLIYFAFELINFVIYPVYRIKTCYLQPEYSAVKTTTNKVIASILRFLISLLPTPFCTGIGQVASSLYQCISVKFLFYKNFKVEQKGNIINKIRSKNE